MTKRSGILYAILLVAVACALGCNGQQPIMTGRGIMVVTNGFHVDMDRIDSIFLSRTECLALLGYTTRHGLPYIEIRCDRPCERIDCDINIGLGTWVHGYQSGRRIVVTPSLAALGHEVVHYHTGAQHGSPEFRACS